MTEREKLIGLQYLRAIAALMVAYFHLRVQTPSYTQYLTTHTWINTDYLQGAVPLFFVISGFVMYVSGIQSSPAKFIWHRIGRIVPLYWCLTLAIVALTLIFPGLLHHTVASARNVTKSLLFIPYSRYPILVPGWSLNFEMFFYALFAMVLFIPLQWRLATLLLTLTTLCAIGVAIPSLRTNEIGLTYTSDFLLLFGFGLVLGYLYKRGRLALPLIPSIALALIGLYALIGASGFGWVRDYAAPVAVVLGIVSIDASGNTPSLPWLLMLGDASYSIYLIHPFAFDLVGKTWQRFHIGSSPVEVITYALLSLGAAVGMALMTYGLIEQPALRLFKWKGTQKVARRATVAAG